MDWDQEAPQYRGGPFAEQYGAGVALLEEAYGGWTSSRSRAHTSRVSATVGVFLTTVLAAVAGVTVLPSNIGHWVAAVTAFGAALVSGLNLAFNPERSAGKEETRVVSWIRLRDDTYEYLRWINGLAEEFPVSELEAVLGRLRASRDGILGG